MKLAGIVGWSGYGDMLDLERSVISKLSGTEVKVKAAPRSLIVEGADPVWIARRVAFMPGVAWVAAGFQFGKEETFTSNLLLLARRYLRPDSTFSLRVLSVGGIREEGDLLLEGTGAVLKAVKNSRVSEKSPDVVFRAVLEKGKGAIGTQLRIGPGGVPTSSRSKATCLVSGGYHSAVMTWMAVLSGRSTTLVHSRDDDESLRQVARLYAELAHRADPSGLKLLVLMGDGTPGERLAAWLDHAKGDIFSGSHPESRGSSAERKFDIYPIVKTPLILLREEEVLAKLDSLGLKRKAVDEKATLVLNSNGTRPFSVKTFGGREADVSGVLDSLLS